MPDINFDCSFCKQNLEAAEDLAGVSVECPACFKVIRIPTPIYIHHPVKKPLGPQPAGDPKVFASKMGLASGEIEVKKSVSDDV